jgi:hypothetical protein
MRKWMLVCVAFAVMASIMAVILWRDLRTERAVNAGLAAQLVEARTLAARLNAPFEAGLPTAQSPNASIVATVPAPAGPDYAALAESRHRAERRAQLADPDYRRSYLVQVRQQVIRSYPGLAQALGLDFDEANSFYEVLAQRELDMRDVSLLVEDVPDDSSLEARENAIGEINRRRDDALTALLGTARFDQFKQYEQERPAWAQLAETTGAMAAVGVPLKPDQSKALVATLVAEHRRLQTQLNGKIAPQRPNDPGAAANLLELAAQYRVTANQRILESAKAYLTSQQLEALQDSLDQQLQKARDNVGRMRDAAAAQTQ